MPLVVEGLRDLQAALAKADREVRLGVRAELRQVAEPVRSTAQSLASERIPRIGSQWPRMRVGVTRNLVYVAPKQRGVKTRGDRRGRPNLANLLMDRAMQPALGRHEHRLEAEMEQMLDRMADRFNAG